MAQFPEIKKSIQNYLYEEEGNHPEQTADGRLFGRYHECSFRFGCRSRTPVAQFP